MALPEDVVTVRKILSRDSSDELHDIAKKLIVDTPELATMWRVLEKRKTGDDDLWIYAFLGAVVYASKLPPYHYTSKQDKQKLSDKISSLAEEFNNILKQNELDAHLIYNDGKMFNGFLLYEDFGDSNQALIDSEQKEKLKASTLIQHVAERAIQHINEETIQGKAGKNVRAIRFIRIMAERNKQMYGKSLNLVIASAANTIFETHYDENGISKLLNRLPGQ